MQSFIHNFPDAVHFTGDIRQANPKDVLSRLKLKAGELDVLVGGPPCQGFSKNVPATWRFFKDPRNLLFLDYLRFVEAIRPKTLLMENVAEMFNAYDGRVKDEVQGKLASLGYESICDVHNAADFGIPQKRRRFVLMAALGKAPRRPSATHSSIVANQQKIRGSTRPWIPAWDAISDLPPVDMGEGQDEMRHSSPAKNDYQIDCRNGSKVFYNHVGAVMKPTQRARIASISAGQGMADLPDHLRPAKGYSGAYGRLDFTSVAPTITRWVFHCGSGRFSHPIIPRTLTMREAARIQGFTDDFRFFGTRIDIAHQIGNAVPALLAKKFAEDCIRPML